MARTAESVGCATSAAQDRSTKSRTPHRHRQPRQPHRDPRLHREECSGTQDLHRQNDRRRQSGNRSPSGTGLNLSRKSSKLRKKIASRDALTGLRNRLCVERQIERQIAKSSTFALPSLTSMPSRRSMTNMDISPAMNCSSSSPPSSSRSAVLRIPSDAGAGTSSSS